ncbi:MAG: hypothetical protein R3E42_16175 [Burkholderiaceae bacterium]
MPTKVVLVLDWQRRVLVRTVGLPGHALDLAGAVSVLVTLTTCGAR